jgi:hypothetical protein
MYVSLLKRFNQTARQTNSIYLKGARLEASSLANGFGHKYLSNQTKYSNKYNIPPFLTFGHSSFRNKKKDYQEYCPP